MVLRGPIELVLDEALRRGVFDLPAPEFFEDDPEVASVIVAGYSVEGGGASRIPDRYMDQAYKTKLLLNRTPNIASGGRSEAFASAYPVRVRNYRVLEVDGPGPFAVFTNGNDGLLKAMLRGRRLWNVVTMGGGIREVDLRESRKNPAFNRYLELRDAGQLNGMTLGEAVALAEALIGENIRLAGDDLGVGGQIDIATITREHGLQWVPQHDPALKAR